jgi:CheY-like chemotaxis protein
MSKRLLLVEDSPTQLITLRSMLESSGYTISSSKNAAEGLVRAYNEQPDLIISDVVMAGINGYQLCRLVKSDPELSSIPVILLTKLDGSVDRFWGMKSGADRFIPKEPGYPSLLKAVRELLDTVKSEPKLRLVGEPSLAPTPHEINARLNQLLERLLFEATIVDEVRKLSEETLDLNILADKLFQLLSSILDYEASALVVNEGSHSSVYTDCAKHVSEAALSTYVSTLSLQLGLPPLKTKLAKQLYYPANSLTQPIDVQGGRLGLLVVVPPTNQAYQPGDQKVVRIICDQLSIVLRIFRLHSKRAQDVQNNTAP